MFYSRRQRRRPRAAARRRNLRHRVAPRAGFVSASRIAFESARAAAAVVRSHFAFVSLKKKDALVELCMRRARCFLLGTNPGLFCVLKIVLFLFQCAPQVRGLLARRRRRPRGAPVRRHALGGAAQRIQRAPRPARRLPRPPRRRAGKFLPIPTKTNVTKKKGERSRSRTRRLFFRLFLLSYYCLALLCVFLCVSLFPAWGRLALLPFSGRVLY